jgi:hypothetical protein
MTEQLFQFIWQYKLFDINAITTTTQGEPIQIMSTGILNTNAGPDFTNAKIKIGDTTWAGDVELHLSASDWLKHKHQEQASYQKIILHVVVHADVKIYDDAGNEFPTIELNTAIAQNLLLAYESLMNNTKELACHTQLASVKSLIVHQQLDRVLIERMNAKADRIKELLVQTNNDWNEVFYISIARAFGSSVNADAFQAMAVRIPLKLLAKQKNNLLQLEAMLFGVSGLLPAKSDDEYTQLLQQEFALLKTKFSLVAMDATRFKFMRMRPANFPTLRIAQLASLIHHASQLMSKVLDASHDVKLLEKLFDAQASSFWESHFTFKDDEHKPSKKSFGKTAIHGIIINTVCPILYQYGKYLGEEKYCEQAIQLLQNLPAEKNKYIDVFAKMNYAPENAFQSQAMIQQYKEYCMPKKCLQCAVGFSVVKKG